MDLTYDPQRASATKMTYQSMVTTPQDVGIVNQFKTTPASSKPDGNPFQHPNNFGNYFQQCSSPAAKWGAVKQAEDSSPCEKRENKGIPCHGIWNNQTRRKGVVAYNR